MVYPPVDQTCADIKQEKTQRVNLASDQYVYKSAPLLSQCLIDIMRL